MRQHKLIFLFLSFSSLSWGELQEGLEAMATTLNLREKLLEEQRKKNDEICSKNPNSPKCEEIKQAQKDQDKNTGQLKKAAEEVQQRVNQQRTFSPETLSNQKDPIASPQERSLIDKITDMPKGLSEEISRPLGDYAKANSQILEKYPYASDKLPELSTVDKTRELVRASHEAVKESSGANGGDPQSSMNKAATNYREALTGARSDLESQIVDLKNMPNSVTPELVQRPLENKENALRYVNNELTTLNVGQKLANDMMNNPELANTSSMPQTSVKPNSQPAETLELKGNEKAYYNKQLSDKYGTPTYLYNDGQGYQYIYQRKQGKWTSADY